MKKVITLLTPILLFITNSKTQNNSFGITAGSTFGSYKINWGDETVISKSRFGFTAGLTSSFKMGKRLYFEPALNFVQKGGKSDDLDVYDLKLNYLEIPFNFVYRTHAGKGQFFAGAGPSVSFGLAGKKTATGAGDGVQKSDIRFGNGYDDDFRAYEFSVNMLAGYQLKNSFSLAANYNTALNSNAYSPGNFVIHRKYCNRYFGLRLGYVFPRK